MITALMIHKIHLPEIEQGNMKISKRHDKV